MPAANPALGDGMDDSEDWKKIKDFVGSKKPQPTNPVADAIQTHGGNREPVKMYDGGVVPDAPDASGDFDVTGGDSTTVKGLPVAGAPGPSYAVLPPQAPVAPSAPPAPVQPPPIPGKPPPMALPGVGGASPSSSASPALDPGSQGEAAKILGGVTPEMLQNLYAKYAKPTTGQQVSEGIAGLGDAIASVGERKPGALQTAREEVAGGRDRALALPEKMAAAGKERFGLAKELQTDNPNSPLSKAAQRTYAPDLKTLGFTDAEISQMPLSLISDATKQGADIGRIRMEMKMKGLELGLKGQELQETGRHNAAEEGIETGRTGEQAAADIAKGSVLSPVSGPTSEQNQAAVAKLSKTAGLGGGAGAAGPYGTTTVRNGKTYIWSPTTNKYHLQQ